MWRNNRRHQEERVIVADYEARLAKVDTVLVEALRWISECQGGSLHGAPERAREALAAWENQ